MRPVTTHEELCKACEHWESRVGERKIKQLADLLVRARVGVGVGLGLGLGIGLGLGAGRGLGLALH